MNSLPGALGASALLAWRLDASQHAATWDSGEGAFRAGGRWNSRGVRAVYCSVDPATAVLEVAVHKSFKVLDTVPHVLTAALISDPASVHVVDTTNVPNPNWLVPGLAGAGQQAFGDDLLSKHPFILVPSVVSRHSWNLVFVASSAAGKYTLHSQEPFALDPRLHPSA